MLEKLRLTVARIATTADERLPELPLLHRSLVPVLSIAASFYRLCLYLRCRLYQFALLPRRRLPVPVISVGNLTWGGNGKTPMVEFIALYLHELGLPPLILSRGYAGGDEAKMLQRHLLHTNAKVGVGVNRIGTASAMFDIYGCMDLSRPLYWEKLLSPHNFGPHCRAEKIGVVILDDGMQHLSLCRDVEIVMINGLAPWGNDHLIPRGSLREPLNALGRAHIGVILHADLVSIKELKDIVTTMRKFSPAIRVFFSSLAPLFFFEVKNPQAKLSLNMMIDKVILCVSAIGFPDAFIKSIKKILPLHVDRLDFSDHHSIKTSDINLIRKRLKLLEDRFGLEVIVIITEKDYDRNPTILEKVDDFLIVVLCSSLQIMPFEDRTDEDFRMILRNLLLCSMSSKDSLPSRKGGGEWRYRSRDNILNLLKYPIF